MRSTMVDLLALLLAQAASQGSSVDLEDPKSFCATIMTAGVAALIALPVITAIAAALTENSYRLRTFFALLVPGGFILAAGTLVYLLG